MAEDIPQDDEAGGRDPLVGRLLDGKYRVESAIARGGIGQVYRGTQEPLGRSVAIKVLAPRERDADTLARHEKRFFREASVSSKLAHPNTVTIHDYGALPDGAGFFLVMEFLDGRTLADLIRAEAPLEVDRVLHIARQIAGSLAEAHAAGVVHRDLKPGNVLLVPRGGDPDYVKVVDFGLVKTLDDRMGEDVTQEGAIVGTPLYMPPEQFVGAPVDLRSDVYALGVVMYEMLTGRPPFVRAEGSQDHSDIILGHMTKRPPAFRFVRPGLELPGSLEALVMRCLHKSPADRFPSMEALLEALANAKTDRTAAPWTPPQAREPDEATTGIAGASRVTPPAAARRTPWALVAAGLLALGGGAAYWASTRPAAEATPSTPAEVAPPTVAEAPTAAPEPPTAAIAAQPDPPAPEAEARPLVVVFHTTPEGADVYEGERKLGPTPLKHPVERSALADGARFTLRKEGFLTETVVQRDTEGSEVVVRLRLTPAPPPEPEGEAAGEASATAGAEADKPARPKTPKRRPKGPGLEIKGDR